MRRTPPSNTTIKRKPTTAKLPALPKLVATSKVKSEAPSKQKPTARASVKTSKYEYDVCVSFAGEDREFAEKVVRSLQRRKITCFYDFDEQAKLAGEDLISLLDTIYREKSQYCLMFVSQYYAKKLWTNHERKSAQAREFLSGTGYIVPVRLDSTEIPGLLPTKGYIDGINNLPTAVAAIIKSKITGEPLPRKTSKTSPTVPNTRAKPTPTPPVKKSPAKNTTSTPSRGKIKASGKWVMLGEYFYEATRVKTEQDRSNELGKYIVEITAKDAREEASLKSLNGRYSCPFAHGNSATDCRVESINMSSEGGKQSFTLTLSPVKKNQSGWGEYSLNNLTSEQIAEKKVRMILLGEKPNTGDKFTDSHIMSSSDKATESDAIKTKLQELGGIITASNLQKVRLYALYQLLSSDLIESVLEFSLGVVSENLSIIFEGQRFQRYANLSASTIHVEGKITLKKEINVK
jgi:TIR domain